MKNFFDTSVLVAAFWGDHPEHQASLDAFAIATPEDSACSAHSLAEVYSTMTRLAVKPAIRPEQALLFIEDLCTRLSVIPLAEADYLQVLQQSAERGITGGQVYDALLLRCASNAEAEVIYTWNVRHFHQIAPDLADRIQAP